MSEHPPTINLPYRSPLDWPRLCAFFARRAIPGVEMVTGQAYRRTVNLDDALAPVHGWLCIEPGSRQHMRLTLSASLVPVAEQVVTRIRRQFDLDSDPRQMAQVLGDLAADHPGIRVPGAFDGFETVVRGILGQQVTVAAASTLAGRIATRLGNAITTPFPELTRTFPAPAVLASVDDDTLGRLGVVRTRIAAIRTLAQKCAEGSITLVPGADVPVTMSALKAIHGIGEWTAQYAAMRALKWADAFPAADYGVLKALGVRKPGQARTIAEAWRPWRAYAAMCLWQSLGD